jgi:hypothetical protein
LIYYESFQYGGSYSGYIYSAFTTLIILLFVGVILVACLKQSLLLPLMKKGYFSLFDTDYIADQLVLEVSDYSRQKRKNEASNTVNLTAAEDGVETEGDLSRDEMPDESAIRDEEEKRDENPDDSKL